jgi:PadR family transcriptional regulator
MILPYTAYVVMGTMGALRMTVAVQAVLGALLQEPDTELYGWQIVNASGLEPGTIYPILQRLLAAGWVKDRWEDPQLAQEGRRPSRHYYKLTMEGHARAVHALQRSRDRSGLSHLLAPPHFPVNPATEAGPA